LSRKKKTKSILLCKRILSTRARQFKDGPHGNWIRGLSKSIEPILVAELWALKDGLYLVKELGFSSIYIKVDAELFNLYGPSRIVFI
jgi:hypothetical protein